MNGRINLCREMFRAAEGFLCEFEGLRASTFAFSTGVEALRLRNKTGYVVMLPFQGQQIWDAAFNGRSLRMKNFFEEPVLSENLLDSYGAFLFHCGALRMGCPGPGDDHPLHGELPGARYNDACIVFGENEKGPYLGLTGCHKYVKAFGDKYRAIPKVLLYADSSLLDVSMTIGNLSAYGMDLMYMCHVNFSPADNGRIVQAAEWNTRDMTIRSSIPAHVKPTPEYMRFLGDLTKNPGVTETLKSEDEYDPERYTAEKKKGNVRSLPSSSSATFTVPVKTADGKL